MSFIFLVLLVTADTRDSQFKYTSLPKKSLSIDVGTNTCMRWRLVDKHKLQACASEGSKRAVTSSPIVNPIEKPYMTKGRPKIELLVRSLKKHSKVARGLVQMVR